MENTDKNLLMEQYKCYMNNLAAIGNQHSQTRAFYISGISALMAFMSFANPDDGDFIINILRGVSWFGFILCLAWFVHTLSYGRLYRVKFNIIRQMEDHMPFQVHKMELEEMKKIKYYYVVRIELFLSLILSIPFICMAFYFLSF